MRVRADQRRRPAGRPRARAGHLVDEAGRRRARRSARGSRSASDRCGCRAPSGSAGRADGAPGRSRSGSRGGPSRSGGRGPHPGSARNLCSSPPNVAVDSYIASARVNTVAVTPRRMASDQPRGGPQGGTEEDRWPASRVAWRSSPARAAASAPRSRTSSPRSRSARSASRRAAATTSTCEGAVAVTCDVRDAGVASGDGRRHGRPLRRARHPRRQRRRRRLRTRSSELDPEHLEEMIDVNVKGAIYTVRAALPHLIAERAADLVTIASEAGRRGLPQRGGVLRLEVRPGRPDRGTRPRAARARRPLHQRLPGRRRDRLRDGPRPHPGHAAAGGHDAAGGRRRGGAVRRSPGRARIASSRSRFRPVTESSWG